MKQKLLFLDDNALLAADDDHSTTEDRFVLLGMSQRLHLLLVCHTHRDQGEVIRIISARKASNAEIRQYFDRWQS